MKAIWLGLNAFSKVFHFRKSEFVETLKLLDAKLFSIKCIDNKNELIFGSSSLMKTYTPNGDLRKKK